MNLIPAEIYKTSRSLIEGLMHQDCFDHRVTSLNLIETHISWVILTGPYAYKIKKPVNLGFLDFSTLEKRQFYCQQELQLNQQLGADIYLEIVTINGTTQEPRISGQGPVIEYAVKMHQFPQSSQLDRMLKNGQLKAIHIDAFAELLASLHQKNNIANSHDLFGKPSTLIEAVNENFAYLNAQIKEQQLQHKISQLEGWSTDTAERLLSVFEKRKRLGFIRECHGDLHLRNMAWVNNKPLVFDCIEFDDNLKWIDVISEIAFLIMDLQKNGCYSLASRFLNRYLESTGDYEGIAVLPFYLCYRAMVRCKVEAIQKVQSSNKTSQHQEAKVSLEAYLQLAQSYSQLDFSSKFSPNSNTKPNTNTVKLIITHGFSASGKTTVSQQVLEKLSAIRIRSDVERKRLLGVNSQEDFHANVGEGIYTLEITRQTYSKLLALAKTVLSAGYTVIIDAAFLKESQRLAFRTLAENLKFPFVILDITAKPNTLRRRIREREKGASDANSKILESQLISAEKLTRKELSFVVVVDTENDLGVHNALERLAG